MVGAPGGAPSISRPDPATGERRRRWETYHAATKKEAEKRLTELQSEADKGMLGADPKMTVAAYLDRWLTAHASGKAPKTHQRYQEIVRGWLVPHTGAKQPGKLGAVVAPRRSGLTGARGAERQRATVV